MASKTRMDLRLDDAVYQGLKSVADDAGISLNQLMAAVARWANDHAHVGRPVSKRNGDFIETRQEPELVWFGSDGMGDQNDDPPGDGNVAFVLDFSDRGAVRHPSEYGIGG